MQAFLLSAVHTKRLLGYLQELMKANSSSDICRSSAKAGVPRYASGTSNLLLSAVYMEVQHSSAIQLPLPPSRRSTTLPSSASSWPAERSSWPSSWLVVSFLAGNQRDLN
ncbi:hypothetical protein PVAP13_2KG392005 [Panicum virgatum]|uniref:Uncharacterized protein n=1 Tax=Panicum virgatum TaxID=38727 RepID=A0A8T0WCS2_PANVG|nr:hypothetical protein PVAP13_2KG392005 [Panicum virgatum]